MALNNPLKPQHTDASAHARACQAPVAQVAPIVGELLVVATDLGVSSSPGSLPGACWAGAKPVQREGAVSTVEGG